MPYFHVRGIRVTIIIIIIIHTLFFSLFHFAVLLSLRCLSVYPSTYSCNRYDSGINSNAAAAAALSIYLPLSSPLFPSISLTSPLPSRFLSQSLVYTITHILPLSSIYSIPPHIHLVAIFYLLTLYININLSTHIYLCL